ncbi:MAG TPA: hypothetical protein ENH99_01595 [Candidatus Pacearchaeota archaeon]|uniref:Uncharacterized protein n=1 Tax=marine sediment metagenome TaxID=412755 RepID=A0A0F9KHZ9_9ZZZZ|nr:hypothetical protein [Candidatus Pacearchaeota archaeon]
MTKEIHILIPTKEDKERFAKITDRVISIFNETTKNLEEQAFLLKMLIESFEDCNKCYIPFEGRFKPCLNQYSGLQKATKNQ